MSSKKSNLPELITLSRNLRLAREAAGLSQQALATRAGLHRSYLVSLENGVGNPSLEKVASLSSCLGTTLVELLTPTPAGPARKPRHEIDSEAALAGVIDALRRAGAID
ncbi:helix-turn-helix domain-containing protein [Sphingomonas pituitosa]|uniref:helix-turn-helix domain-containing protein n=1 Tax=Sphingomonas pituitosa TaxID=99597 RepID=UPI000A015CAA|nr:helix-turn-helix transcriptional regulator [Sphingomonas pituitosa]